MRISAPRTVVICLLALVASGCGEEPKAPEKKLEQQRYLPPSPAKTPLPELSFSDVTAASGIAFRHETGAFTRPDGGDSRYLPECMGSGVILFDPDGDGDEDVFLVNSSFFEGHEKPGERPVSRLYLNEGGLRFRDVTENAGLDVSGYGMGGAAADYDGDGDQDLLVTYWGGVRLFRNEGGLRFEDVTDEAGLVMPGWRNASGQAGPDWSTSAAFFDADRDGDLDLFVCNYVRWTPETDVDFSLDGKHKSFTVPDRYEGNSCRFFRNDGRGRFEDVTRRAGVFNDDGKSLGIALWDFNGDGLLDVVIANDQAPNFFYVNKGDGTFEERGLDSGIAYDENGKTRAGMGIDVATHDNDGVPSIAIGNFSREPVALYRQEGKDFFRDITQQAGVAAATLIELTFGLIFADLDLDGRQDIVTANGHLEPRVQDVWADIPYAQSPVLLHNQGGTRFVRWNDACSEALRRPMVGRGLACADLDGDGDLDLVITANGGPARILRNDLNPARPPLRIRLRGKAPNRDAIGAFIDVEGPAGTQRRLVHTGSSYLSQSEFVQTFALGTERKVERIRVTWPDGSVQTLEDPDLPPRGVLLIEQH